MAADLVARRAARDHLRPGRFVGEAPAHYLDPARRLLEVKDDLRPSSPGRHAAAAALTASEAFYEC